MKNPRKIAVAFAVALTFVAGGLSVQAQNDIIIVDNLTNNADGISGLKNAQDTSYAQGFESTINGNLNSLIMNLGLQSTTGNSSGQPYLSSETMSIFLYAAESDGDPVGNALATLATDITATDVEGGIYDGYTQNNDSFIYQYTVDLSSNPAIVAGDDYAIGVTFYDGIQDIGWAEESGSDPEPAGEVGQMDTIDGYGRMEVDIVPEPSSFALLAALVPVYCLFRYRRASA